MNYTKLFWILIGVGISLGFLSIILIYIIMGWDESSYRGGLSPLLPAVNLLIVSVLMAGVGGIGRLLLIWQENEKYLRENEEYIIRRIHNLKLEGKSNRKIAMEYGKSIFWVNKQLRKRSQEDLKKK